MQFHKVKELTLGEKRRILYRKHLQLAADLSKNLKGYWIHKSVVLGAANDPKIGKASRTTVDVKKVM